MENIGKGRKEREMKKERKWGKKIKGRDEEGNGVKEGREKKGVKGVERQEGKGKK